MSEQTALPLSGLDILIVENSSLAVDLNRVLRRRGGAASVEMLAHVAYALSPMAREERAAQAKVVINAHFSAKQQVFLDFVLSQYVKVGVQELDREKLSPLLKLKYNNAIADAVADLGRPEEIGKLFAGFQRYLYEEEVAA